MREDKGRTGARVREVVFCLTQAAAQRLLKGCFVF
jgi:hypothetical protein